jgi:pyruvate dehydrogenase E1 component
VILAKTIKGYGMGESGEAMNITHQQKKLPVEQLKRSATVPPADHRRADRRRAVPQVRGRLEGTRIHAPARMELGGYLPHRRQKATSLPVPALDAFEPLLKARARAARSPRRWPSCAS